MYKAFIRPFLFFFTPEFVHHLIVYTIKGLFKIPGISAIFHKLFTVDDSRLQKEFLDMKFRNPVGLAAGFDKNAVIFNEFSLLGFGFIEIGTVTPRPQPGNPKPRLFRLVKDKALINRMGFNNIGVDKAVENITKYRRNNNIIIGGNIGKNTDTPNEKAVDDYLYCFRMLYDHVDYFVVNVSCPNITNLSELQDKDKLIQILESIMKVRDNEYTIKKPVLLKISPDLNKQQIDNTLEIVRDLKIDGIVAINTTITRDNLHISDDKIRKIGRGGLSGKPLTLKAREIISYISSKTDGKLPIIGVGGIMTEEDAWQLLQAGASIIQLYTGFIYQGPAFVKKINKYILRKL